jgi:putative ABC transport system ATP-binding protein
VIEMAGIEKVFEAQEHKTHALSGVDLKIDPGEFVAIRGPRGSGKSTLMSILGLHDAPTAGTYRFNGANVSRLSEAERNRIRTSDIGFLFQTFNLLADLTVFENVEIPLTYRGVSSSERRRRATHALELVGLAHRSRHFASQLSAWQQQRVALARAIVGHPTILLADEPTGSLDTKNAEAFLELLKELHRLGTTICLVTDAARPASFAQRTIHMFDGRIVGPVTPPSFSAADSAIAGPDP